MLVENLKWRKINKMDTICNENFDDMKREFPTSTDTFDKEGRPVGTLDVSQWNIRNAVITGRAQRLLRYTNMLMEHVTRQVLEMQKNKLNVTQWTVVMNAEGVNMINHGCRACIQIWVQFMTSMDNHYPEWLHEFIAIDAPLTTYTIVRILQPFLFRHTREHMRLFGTDSQNWRRYLDSKISRDQRSEVYGGNKKSTY
ncbi:unnamed protein product [Orchesella dallaii]|uniref:CRAL-TRIO domain-containing protein n=2 Tax=Orchesella dallaii TaxID=48710 RepID=A0ABP1RUW5_9HEXA